MGKKTTQRSKSQSGLAALAQIRDKVPLSKEEPITEDIWDLPDRSRSEIPLQVLKLDDCATRQSTYRGLAEADKIQTLLCATAASETSWRGLYTGLCQRVENLSTVFYDSSGKEHRAIIDVEFSGLMRVGGLPGFWERLLPVMHPVYGIPYIPASSIKGALKAWARETERPDIDRLLGFLNGKKARTAAVQILDAFPTEPCLKADVATPQWTWDKHGRDVNYGPAPHPSLSLENVKLRIGICQTSLGTIEDVKIVLSWLEDALLTYGLGSRISTGYGVVHKANGRNKPLVITKKRFTSRHEFELWSQGIYGLNRNKAEFRMTAVRGILRYWFRAIILGLFPVKQCKLLESILFGTIEPRAFHGHFRISASISDDVEGNSTTPQRVSGCIVLETQTQDQLKLLQNLFCLATHLGGVGRGSRRPLHNNDGVKGCYWQFLEKTMQLQASPKQWNDFLNHIKLQCENVKKESFTSYHAYLLKHDRKKELKEFAIVQNERGLGSGSPGLPGRGNRKQDVLNANTQIYIIKTPTVKLPSETGWDSDKNRGKGLDFFYSSGYKGENRKGQGNQNVGGALGTPSFVWIASNCLRNRGEAYQVITVFGANQSDRKAFSEALKNKGAELVWQSWK